MKPGKSYSLPIPLMNIINGGAHADNDLNIQEFMIRPDSAKNFMDAIEKCFLVIQNLKKLLQSKKMLTNVGDEGGFAPELDGTEDALETILKAIGNAGYKAGEEVMIALDCAAAEFYKDGVYDYTLFEGDKAVKRSSEEQAQYLADLCSEYPIISIEDGMDENDWDGWKALTLKAGNSVQLVERYGKTTYKC